MTILVVPDGDKMNMPFSLKKGMINQFNSMNVSNNLNPYKIANDPTYYKNFVFEEELNIQQYVRQLKNIQQFVTNTKSNSSDISTTLLKL